MFNFFLKQAPSEAADFKQSHKRLANDSVLIFFLQLFASQESLTFRETIHFITRG